MSRDEGLKIFRGGPDGDGEINEANNTFKYQHPTPDDVQTWHGDKGLREAGRSALRKKLARTGLTIDNLIGFNDSSDLSDLRTGEYNATWTGINQTATPKANAA